MSAILNETHNDAYKQYVLSTLENNQQTFCPMRREQQMDALFAWLQEDFKTKHLSVLDACCGYGRLIHFMNELDPQQTYHGVDFVAPLIQQAKTQFAGQPNISFECADMLHLSQADLQSFDITICYKTLFNFNYYEALLKELVTVTRRKIYITSLFYDGDIDFISQIYTAASQNTGTHANYNTYSLPKFKNYCKTLGVKDIRTLDMRLDFDLPPPENPDQLQTYTVPVSTPQLNQNRLEITGNIILNWKLIELTLS